jgi:hypothetical protein
MKITLILEDEIHRQASRHLPDSEFHCQDALRIFATDFAAYRLGLRPGKPLKL